MARMTEEEAFALDEKWTKTDPKVGSNGSGFLSKRKAARMITRPDKIILNGEKIFLFFT